MNFNFKSFWDIVKEIDLAFLNSLKYYSVTKIGRDFHQLYLYFFIKRLNELMEKDAEIIVDWHPYGGESEVTTYFDAESFIKESEKIFTKLQKLLPYTFIKIPFKKNGVYSLENIEHDICQQILKNYQKKANFSKLLKILKTLINNCEKSIKIQNFHSALINKGTHE